MQNYRADPVGPAGVCGVPRGTEGKTSGGHGEEEREGGGRGARQEGPAASQPTSTSGLVKVSTAGPPVPPRPPHSVTSSGFFSSCSRIFDSLRLTFSHQHGLPFFPLPPLPCFHDGVRTALSRHTVLGPTPSSVCRRINVSFLFARTILRSCEIPISGDTRVIGRRRIA